MDGMMMPETEQADILRMNDEAVEEAPAEPRKQTTRRRKAHTEPETDSRSQTDMPLIIASMITKPKPKGAIPTFVTFHEGDQVPERHVILDVPEPFLSEAWNYYKDNAKNPSADDFLIMVYDIMKMGIPRLYRKVAKLNLE